VKSELKPENVTANPASVLAKPRTSIAVGDEVEVEMFLSSDPPTPAAMMKVTKTGNQDIRSYLAKGEMRQRVHIRASAYTSSEHRIRRTR